MKSRQLDQFYTNTNVSENCMKVLKEEFALNDFFLLEPSAGTGAFSDLFHANSLALDLDPKREYIIKKDFLKINKSTFENKKVFTIGNPPFGKNSSTAIKFFNKAAEFSEYIAFIVPKTFKKVSVTNKLDLHFELLLEHELPLNSFIFEDNEYSVPCVFQVWKKSEHKREKVSTSSSSSLFEFTTRDSADFAVRLVGGLAGKVIKDFSEYKDSSHYFIKSKIKKNSLIQILIDSYAELQDMAKNSAGNPSLSKFELVNALEGRVA